MQGKKSEVLKWLVDAPDGMYEVKEYHEKRSLTANSYYWVLLRDLAGRLRTSKDELHEIMLKRYGQYLRDKEGNIVCVAVSPDTRMQDFDGHFEYEGPFRGYARYKVLRGSRTYDSKEFSILLDGLISECHEVGIDTMTPDEIARLKGYEKAHESDGDPEVRKRRSVYEGRS